MKESLNTIPSITSYSGKSSEYNASAEQQPDWKYDGYEASAHDLCQDNWSAGTAGEWSTSNNVYIQPIAAEPTPPPATSSIDVLLPTSNTPEIATPRSGRVSSPKRLSLDARLAQEHGVQLADPMDPSPVPMPVPKPNWKIPDFSALVSN